MFVYKVHSGFRAHCKQVCFRRCNPIMGNLCRCAVSVSSPFRTLVLVYSTDILQPHASCQLFHEYNIICLASIKFLCSVFCFLDKHWESHMVLLCNHSLKHKVYTSLKRKLFNERRQNLLYCVINKEKLSWQVVFSK